MKKEYYVKLTDLYRAAILLSAIVLIMMFFDQSKLERAFGFIWGIVWFMVYVHIVFDKQEIAKDKPENK